MKGFRYMSNVATLELSKPLCIGCGRCPEVCPHQVFTIVERKASIVALDACMECGACARNCPVNALKVEAGVGCATGLISEWLRERNITGTGGGGCS